MGKEKKKDDWQPYPGDDDHTVHYNPRKDPLHVPKHPDLHNSREERRAARLRAKGLLPDPVEEVKEKKEVKKVEIESFDNDEGEDDDYYDESPKKKKKQKNQKNQNLEKVKKQKSRREKNEKGEKNKPYENVVALAFKAIWKFLIHSPLRKSAA